jgi:hypothetical protein
VDVAAAAERLGALQRRRERHVEAVPGRDPADGQPQRDVAVGGDERLGGRDRDLELTRPGLGLQLLDVQPKPLEHRHQLGGEALDLEQPGGAEGGPRAQLVPQQRELDLERDPEIEAARRGDVARAAQERAGTGGERAPVLVDLVHRRPCDPLVQQHRGVEVRHHPQVAGGSLEPVVAG